MYKKYAFFFGDLMKTYYCFSWWPKLQVLSWTSVPCIKHENVYQYKDKKFKVAVEPISKMSCNLDINIF